MNLPLPPLDAVLARLTKLPAATAAEAARADQQARWSAGQRVLAERYLAGLPYVAASPEDALVVVYGEMLIRTELGEAVDADVFADRFPQYRDALESVFEVHRVLNLTASQATADAPPLAIPEAIPTIPGYDRLRLAGRGGLGVVYRARSIATGYDVAIKLVRAAGAARSEELLRFLQEADILARLAHPNVVQFLGSGVAEAGPYLVTELVVGGSLADRVGQPVGFDQAVEIVRGVARGLGAAHAVGVIHRDVKPGNVLIADTGGAAVPKLTDFGLARLVGCGGTLTTSGERLGTRRYMPPEQLDGRAKEVGPWSDLFSLGALLYEMLTGHPAFPERDIPAWLDGFAEPVSPRALDPGIPPPIEAVCLKALQRNPADRYQSTAALLDDLARV